MMRVRFLPRARAQLGEIHEYVALENLFSANAIVMRVETIADLLSKNPRLGRVISPSGVRAFPVRPYPYVIYYRIRSDVEILRVRHAARRRLQFHDPSSDYRL
jgi:plasmid stabilization system protein ParE